MGLMWAVKSAVGSEMGSEIGEFLKPFLVATPMFFIAVVSLIAERCHLADPVLSTLILQLVNVMMCGCD